LEPIKIICYYLKMYENALEIVLLNKDPTRFVYYPRSFRNPSTNPQTVKKHIQKIISLGTPMTPTFLEIVKKFHPTLYKDALKNPVYTDQEVTSTGYNLVRFLRLRDGELSEDSIMKEPEIEEKQDIPAKPNNSENVELEESLLKLDRAMVEEEIDALESAKQLQGPNDPLMISEKVVNPRVIPTDTIHTPESEYSPEQTRKTIDEKLISTPQVPFTSRASVISKGSSIAEDTISYNSSFPSFNSGEFENNSETEISTNDSRAYFPIGKIIDTKVDNVNNNAESTLGVSPGSSSDDINFATNQVKNEHAPKYHLDSILFYFGSTTRPDWDQELEVNVFKAKLKKDEIIKFSDSVIANYGSIFFVYKRKSDTIQEFHELIQLQFCYLRNLARSAEDHH
jgi:glutaredoxin-related protein